MVFANFHFRDVNQILSKIELPNPLFQESKTPKTLKIQEKMYAKNQWLFKTIFSRFLEGLTPWGFGGFGPLLGLSTTLKREGST